MAKQFENVIKWDNKNKTTLKIAVNTFNKRVRDLQKTEKIDYLPDEINLNEIRKEITTENELKRIVSSLRKFKQESQAELFINEEGQKMTVWEKEQIEKATERANKRINKRLDVLYNKPLKDSKYSRAQMGSEEVRTLEKRKKALSKFNEKKGYDFKEFKRYAFFQGATDYEMKKAIVYEQNYRKVLRRYEGLYGYEFLQEQLKRIQSPLEFYDLMKDGDEHTVDLTYQSDQTMNVSGFINFLETVFGKEEFEKWQTKNFEKAEHYYNEAITSEETWLN